MKSRMVIAGGSGFIGSALAADWLARGGEVVVLTRSPRQRKDGAIEAQWDGVHIGEWIQYLNGAEAVVGLAGKNINCRHTPEAVRQMAESRVSAVQTLAAGIAHVTKPPRVWVQAGAIGFYGNRGDAVLDEHSSNGVGALAGICREWESAFEPARPGQTRKILLRIGVVLGRDGGALPVLARLTRLFLGGSAGNGRQFISWIHLADLTRMFLESVNRPELAGTFNAVAPGPVTNKEFMRQLRRALHRPWSPPAPGLAVKIGTWLLGTEASLALDGCRVLPKRFQEAGFQFQFPELAGALSEIERG
ncbi:MAG TPA: TIGR01777 family oxidoreductase [Candidatus Sulfotelmatobacter sp.]|nr:TIGR01777 family oxidoreductase [Candidatus Sulfotelmatobacter sp.]